MANTFKSVYKRFNGVDWDIHHFASVTSQVASDSASRRYISDDQLSWLGTYFNGSVDLLDGMLDLKAPLANPTFTGTATIPLIVSQYGLYNESDESTGVEFASDTIRFKTNDDDKMQILSDRIQFENNRLRLVGTPVDLTDAATKGYVDAVTAAGMHPVTYVKAAADTNQSLSACVSVDGYTLLNGDRVLLKGQTTATQNGIYTSNGSGGLTKVTADSTQGAYVFVANGINYNDWYFYCQDNVGTWIEQGRPDTVTASGALERVGNDISIKTGGITNDMVASYTLAWNRLQTNMPYDNSDGAYDSWTELPVIGSDSENLAVWLNTVLASIGILRGTPNYNTNNAETIAGAYDIAEVKNRTYEGSGDPTTTNRVEGDIYLQHPAA